MLRAAVRRGGGTEFKKNGTLQSGVITFGTARHDRCREHAVLGEGTELASSMGYERRSVWTLNRRGAAPYTSITRRRFLGMGAGSSSFAGCDFYVNHFGVATYAGAVGRDRLPVARWLHLGRWGGAAYDAFWQAYAGGVDRDALARSYGLVVAAARAGLAPDSRRSCSPGCCAKPVAATGSPRAASTFTMTWSGW